MVAKVKKWGVVACVAAVLIIAVAVLSQMRWATAERSVGQESEQSETVADSDVKGPAKENAANAEARQEEAPDGEEAEAEEPKTEDELREEAEEKAVDSFDALTDKWMEKEGGEVSMKDMDEFVKSFKSVPDNRKEECLQRALNLVSDDHVLLLAGVLFDKTIDKELVELVFNDVLNRDESVKKLILPMIYKDKEHPCWADTAWILDVTGETPKKENNQ